MFFQAFIMRLKSLEVHGRGFYPVFPGVSGFSSNFFCLFFVCLLFQCNQTFFSEPATLYKIQPKLRATSISKISLKTAKTFSEVKNVLDNFFHAVFVPQFF